MGSSQSASSTRKDTDIQELQSNGGPAVPSSSHPDGNDTFESMQTPAEKGEGSTSQRVVGRRRSLMKFPSLRRRTRSIVGLSDEVPDAPVIGSPSPSRRRWRAFSGLKSRPVSTIAASSSPPTDLQPSRDQDVPASPTVSAANEKGKAREADAMDAVQPDDSGTSAPEPTASASGPSHPALEDRGSALSPDTLLRELSELQETLSTGNDAQSTDPPLDCDCDTLGQVDRPPTPIPTSVIDPTPESEEGDATTSASHAALIEALGSWMGGRSRGENAESVPNDAPIASSSRPWSAGPSASQRPLGNFGNSLYNESDLLGSFARNSSRAASALGSPPAASSSGSRQVQNSQPAPTLQDRRTLPPAGTGTLVVVQGVVHTTDVRHPHPPASSPFQTPAAPMRRPRSASSTPTLRGSSPARVPQSASRASTPQPQPQPHSSSRHGRLSSLASGLRPLSRPRTSSSLRSTGIGGWRHSFAGTGAGSGNPSETASERSVGLMGSSASDSETATASTSATGTSASRDDASVAPSAADSPPVNSQGQGHIDRDETPGPQVRTQGHGGPANGDTRASEADGGDGDSTSDEEGEAELSASSIEVLGTLLSVATAATAASLVTGTTDPLFSSGLAGPFANARNTASAAPDGSPPASGSPFPHSTQSPAPPSPGADNGNAEAAVNTRMRAAWESLRDRFSRTRGRRSGGAAEDAAGEGREDPREQMLREMARAFNMGLGLDQEEPRAEQREGAASEGTAAAEGAAVPDAPPPPNEASPTEGNRTASEPGGLGPSPGPEGSFERFLHNLQVDLRTALTEDYAARRARAQARGARTTVPSSATPSDGMSSPPSAEGTEAAVGPSDPTSEASSEVRPVSEVSVRIDDSDADPPSPVLMPTIPNTPRAANLDLPPLPGDTDALPRDGSSFGPTPPQAQGITGQPGAGINWWRLYRFPPMQLVPHSATANPNTSTAAGIPAQPQPASSENSASLPSEPPRPSTSGNTEPRSPGSTMSPPSLEAAANQNVVPVIVVGLQSVPVNRAGAHHHHDDPPSPFGPPPEAEPSPSTDGHADAPARDLVWPLRAASRAFGRMGRRTEADPSTPIDAGTTSPTENVGAGIPRVGRHGGRTYLIFVIGGYYPPNHSIVTGADDMNSFEALWELAELLGQVKPPVASKDDIEKSGLEIIKASSLSGYEKAGKVASNTVERCLICLDDYDPEDNLRLLSCRHIFHKLCVDKWLEQGRNNCPACRTKGVRTGDESPTSATTEIPSGNPLGDLD